MAEDKRVFVTGFGSLTPVGNTDQTWNAVLNGQSAITRIKRVDLGHVPVQIGGEISDNSYIHKYVSIKDARRMPLVSKYAVIAACRAQVHAGIDTKTIHDLKERVGVVLGTTMGPHLLAEQMTSAFRNNGHKRPNPVDFTNCLPNMPAHYVSRVLQAHGPLYTPVAACATGTQALGLATDMIRNDQVDVVFVGATEAILQDYIYAGFASLRALAEGYEDNPEQASRPFDAARSGFVLSEGAAVLVLESEKHAHERQANLWAEIAGHANTSDAYHIAAIHPDAKGMKSAMMNAIANAGIKTQDIAYINAHGTGTILNDQLETKALKHVFGNHASRIDISSTKGVTGHMMATAGALEAIITLKALRQRVVPPTINLTQADPKCDLNYTPQQQKPMQNPNAEYAMSNNFGLGGQNASVIFRRISENPK